MFFYSWYLLCNSSLKVLLNLVLFYFDQKSTAIFACILVHFQSISSFILFNAGGTMTEKVKHIGVFLLVMLIVGSIDSIRNLPATALFGTELIFFFIFSAIVFLIPAGLISAELSSAWTEYGGIFDWVRLAFGEKVGFVAIWLQWINTMVWYPTILSFIAGIIAYLIDPSLAENKVYLVSIILVVFWALTIINFKGIHTSAKFASYCTVIGMLIPMGIIVVLAIIWLASGNVTQIHFSAQNMIPHLGTGASWVSLTAIMTAYLGMELATVHVRSVHVPQRTFPKALFISVILILATMIFGSLAICIVLPHNTINLVDGVVQAFSAFFANYHMGWMLPVIIVMMLIGSLGGMINWIISPAKGLLRASKYGFMPKVLSKENDKGVARNMLLLQAVLVSVVCLAFLLMPTVNASYWLLTDLSTEVYMLMYVMMFIAALRLKYKHADRARPFEVPGGKFGMWVVTLLGLFGCVLTLYIGFFPPDGIDVGGAARYHLIFGSGVVIMILPVVLFYIYRAVTHEPSQQDS